MGTAATPTRVDGPWPVGDHYEMDVSLALDHTDGTGIMTVDLTSWFSYVYACYLGDNDTLADNAYVYRAICPAKTVALTSTNVAISVHESTTGAPAALVPVTSADLSTVGALKMRVVGRAAV